MLLVEAVQLVTIAALYLTIPVTRTQARSQLISDALNFWPTGFK